MEYKGITWNNYNELAKKLDVTYYSVVSWVRRNKDLDITQYIDYKLADSHDRIRHTSGSYCGITWINHNELADKLNVSRQYICKIYKNGLLNDYIERKICV